MDGRQTRAGSLSNALANCQSLFIAIAITIYNGEKNGKFENDLTKKETKTQYSYDVVGYCQWPTFLKEEEEEREEEGKRLPDKTFS